MVRYVLYDLFENKKKLIQLHWPWYTVAFDNWVHYCIEYQKMLMRETIWVKRKKKGSRYFELGDWEVKDWKKNNCRKKKHVKEEWKESKNKWSSLLLLSVLVSKVKNEWVISKCEEVSLSVRIEKRNDCRNWVRVML